VADNELSCNGTFVVKDSHDTVNYNSLLLPMCAAGQLAVDTTALTMYADLPMHLRCRC
jgi:hypothetical protein